MSDLTATNCGCGCDNGNNGCCSTLIWLLLLTSCCGNGNGLFGGNGCGNDNSCCLLYTSRSGWDKGGTRFDPHREPTAV